jgi:hypothetical protein
VRRLRVMWVFGAKSWLIDGLAIRVEREVQALGSAESSLETWLAVKPGITSRQVAQTDNVGFVTFTIFYD